MSGRQPVDPPERQKDHLGTRRARASPVSSSWAAPQRQDRSEGKAAISGLHRQSATARPVDHRPFARSLGSRLQPGSRLAPPLPRSFWREAGQPGSRPASAVPPEGTRWAGQGDQDRRARDWLGTRQASARRSREHRPDQLGWRPARRPEPGTRPEGGRPVYSRNRAETCIRRPRAVVQMNKAPRPLPPDCSPFFDPSSLGTVAPPQQGHPPPR